MDTRKLIVSEKEAYEISKNSLNTFIINGQPYYLGKGVRICNDVYEMTLFSKEMIEIEIEIGGDEQCQEIGNK